MKKSILPPATQYFNKYVGDGQLESPFNQDTSAVVRFNLCDNRFTYKGMISISKANLLNLKELILNGNKIGGLGCKYISRAEMPSVKRLCIDRNNVGSAGLLHLSKGNWNNIQQISLVYNEVARNGTYWLSKSRWRTETQILLASNKVRLHQLLILLLYQEKYLKSADLRAHQLSPQEKKRLAVLFSLKFGQVTRIFI